nr:hypothetical protein Iba_chr03aCG3470 [Ipomoea batatas]
MVTRKEKPTPAGENHRQKNKGLAIRHLNAETSFNGLLVPTITNLGLNRTWTQKSADKNKGKNRSWANDSPKDLGGGGAFLKGRNILAKGLKWRSWRNGVEDTKVTKKQRQPHAWIWKLPNAWRKVKMFIWCAVEEETTKIHIFPGNVNIATLLDHGLWLLHFM